MSELARRLAAGPCLLLDGGMGSMLLARGLPPGEAPERLNIERPELVLDVHRAYVAAGCDAVQTNTFGGHPARLALFDLARRCGEIHRAAVDLARRAGPRFVVGDIGPTGEYLPPVGKGETGRWAEGFEEQARHLVEAGVDALHVETMSDVREAEAALGAARRVSADIPVLVSLAFERKRKGFFTIMGDAAAPALARLLAAGATAAGANCGIASGDMRDLAAALLAETPGRLVFQPNAGLPRQGPEGLRYAQDPEEFADDMLPAVTAGAAAIGGCCGTDPRFLAALGRHMGRDR